MNLDQQTTRRVGWVGVAIVLLVDFLLSLRSGRAWLLGIVVLFLFSLAIVLVSLLLMPRTAGTLVRHIDLLLPLAFVTLASRLIEWLSAAPVIGSLFSPAWPLHILSLSFSISFAFLLQIAVAVAYAAWITATLLQFVRLGKDDPFAVLPGVPSRFWRVLGLEFIGWTLVLLGTAVMLLLMPVLFFVAILLLGVFGVVLNFWTAAVLPVGLEAEGGVWRAFRSGMAVSRSNVGKWWLLLLVQMVLLGLVFIYYSRSGMSTNTNWSVNVFWTGGYDADCRWYTKLADAFHMAKVPVIETLLTFYLGAFAVAIKLAIIQRLQPPELAPEAAQSFDHVTSNA